MLSKLFLEYPFDKPEDLIHCLFRTLAAVLVYDTGSVCVHVISRYGAYADFKKRKGNLFPSTLKKLTRTEILSLLLLSEGLKALLCKIMQT